VGGCGGWAATFQAIGGDGSVVGFAPWADLCARVQPNQRLGTKVFSSFSAKWVECVTLLHSHLTEILWYLQEVGQLAMLKLRLPPHVKQTLHILL